MKGCEEVIVTDAAIGLMINHYCNNEAGVRNLRKCLDRIFRKVVTRLEEKSMQEEQDLRSEALA